MKEGWEYKKLGEVCEILNGFAFKSSNYVPEGVRVIRITNVQKGYVEDNDPKYYPYETKDELSRYLLKEGDMLLSLTGNVGRVAILGKSFLPAYLNQRVACIRVRKGVELDLSFLFHLLYSQKFEDDCIKSSNGAAQLNMSTVWLASYLIPVPPLSEQQSIVDYLDAACAKIDAMKANAEKALNEAKALFQASLKEMLEPKEGLEEKALGEVSVFSQGIQVDVNLQTEICSPGKVRFLRIIDVTQGNVPPRYIDDPGERYYLKPDEIAMVRYGTVGFVCYGFEGVIANNLFKISIKDKSKLQSTYLQYFLKSDLFQSHIRKGVGGAALPAIKFGDIKHIMLGVPPLSEQQRIVDYLDSLKTKVDRLQENYNKISQECDALKQAILRQVFE